MDSYDLHGLTVTSAAARLAIILHTLIEEEEISVCVITGAGSRALATLVEDECHRQGFFYKNPRHGVYIIYNPYLA